MGPESRRKEARPRAASLRARSEAGSVAFRVKEEEVFCFLVEVEYGLRKKRKKKTHQRLCF